MTNKNLNPMWGGHFTEAANPIMEVINTSIDFDKRLATHDIEGSRALCCNVVRVGHRFK